MSEQSPLPDQSPPQKKGRFGCGFFLVLLVIVGCIVGYQLYQTQQVIRGVVDGSPQDMRSFPPAPGLQDVAWKPFTPENRAFSVDFPGNPMTDNISMGSVTGKLAQKPSSTTIGLSFMVIHYDLDEPLPNRFTELVYLKRLQDNDAANGKILQDKVGEMSNCAYREYTLQLNGQAQIFARGRALIHQKKVAVLMMAKADTRDKVNSAEATKYLDSFSTGK